MSQVTEEEACGWVEIARERIQRRQDAIELGTADQLVWEGWSEWQMELGRALFLHGEPIERAREAFRNAARGFERIFIMAFDESSPHYLGRGANPSAVSDDGAIDGLNAALMGADFEQAGRLARWVPPEPSDPGTPAEVRQYTRALQHLLLGKPEEARALVARTLRKYEGRPPREAPRATSTPSPWRCRECWRETRRGSTRDCASRRSSTGHWRVERTRTRPRSTSATTWWRWATWGRTRARG